MKKNGSKIFLISSIVFVAFLLIIVVYNYMGKEALFDQKINFSLVGEKEIILNVGDVYQENGVLAFDGNGNDIRNQVVIKGDIDTSRVGIYTITYTLTDSKGISKTLERKVNVNYSDKFMLNGDSSVYMLIGGVYTEEGVKAFYNSQDYSSKITISSDIDATKSGNYTVRYTFKEMNNEYLERKVYVSDFSDYFKVDYSKALTNKSVTLNVEVDFTKVLKYTLPNGQETQEFMNYTVTANGTYDFIIYDKYGNSITKSIVVDNIDTSLPTATCNFVLSSNKTIVTVNANKKIVNYIYNGISSTSNTYTFNERLNSVSVKIIDEVGNEASVNCTSSIYTEQMEIHFIASGHYDDAILIRTDTKTILIDGGRYNCRLKVTPYLQELGVTHIDAMIGSHIQNDHIATQGDILSNFSVDKVYYADDIFTCASRGTCASVDREYIVPALRNYNKTPEIVTPGSVITIGEMTLYFLGPYQITNNQNNNSLIFILKFRNNTFMFTGDSGNNMTSIDKIQPYATAMNISLDVDMLKYPHHGNETLTDSFLSVIRPEIIVVPNYNASQYPSTNNINRISQYGVMYRQSDYKNILLLSDGNKIQVVTNVSASSYKR